MTPKGFILLLKSLQEIRPGAYLHFRIKLVDFDIEKKPEGPDGPDTWKAWLTEGIVDKANSEDDIAYAESGERAMGALLRKQESKRKP